MIIQTVTISFYRFDGAGARVWALTQMGLARWAMARVPDLAFWKLCGSGVGEGFTPRPNFGVYAILATWPDRATAQRRLAESPVFRRYRRKAAENWTIYLNAISARGAWSGCAPFETGADNTRDAAHDFPAEGDGAPLAVLTRATIKPSALKHFWGKEPPISAAIGTNSDVLFKIGIGEAPLLQQITFSVWPDAASMARFAHQDGPHKTAIRAVREGGWFREELYARFRILGSEGAWNGTNPLAPEKKIAA